MISTEVSSSHIALHTFPKWYTEKTIFDRCILTNLFIGLKEQGEKENTLTIGLIASKENMDLPSRQTKAIRGLASIVRQQPARIKEIFNSTVNRGLAINIDHQIFTFGVALQYIHNHQAALQFVESELLSTPSKIKTPEEMESFICQLHAKLTHNLVNASHRHINAGHYREGIILLPKNGSLEPAEIFSFVKAQNPSALKTFITLHLRIMNASDQYEEFKQLTNEEKEVFAIGFDTLYPLPEELPTLMKKFSKEYLEKIQSGINAIDLATWVHTELIAIHPFDDGNGHLSRMLANAELIRGGSSPAFIFSDTDYLNAQKNKNPQEFKEYLLQSISLAEKLGQLLEKETPFKKTLVQC